jgi:tetratricopeptide (TPR) repeat protein
MSATAVRVIGIAGTLVYGCFIVWLYVTRPRTLAEIKGGVTAAVGLYEIDAAEFEAGRALFRVDRFPEARAAFARADPAQRDATTQFYVAYSFYRQGWGRIYNDNALFAEALRALDRAISHSDTQRIQVSDPNLGLPDSDRLRAELERGLKLELRDFNPLRVLRPRQ